jgi:hypothetical protein
MVSIGNQRKVSKLFESTLPGRQPSSTKPADGADLSAQSGANGFLLSYNCSEFNVP